MANARGGRGSKDAAPDLTVEQISRLDLLLCRNVFIYMDGDLQHRMLTRFHYALRNGGPRPQRQGRALESGGGTLSRDPRKRGGRAELLDAQRSRARPRYPTEMRKAMTENTPLRAEQVPDELPNGSEGRVSVAAVPIVDEGTVLGAVISFEDATRVANLAAELAALKSDGAINGKRNRR